MPPDSQPEQDEVVIDPNLYGPFGHRYRESSLAIGQHIEVDPSDPSWHDVETTEQHLQHSNATAIVQHSYSIPHLRHGNGASHETVIPVRPPSGSDSTLGFIPHAAPMGVEKHRDSLISSQCEKFDRRQSHTHLRRRSKSHHPHQHTRTGSLFDLVHGKDRGKPSEKPHVEVHGDDLPITFRHLLKRPLIRQWLHGNKLYREKDERKPSQFELVFDLIFVAVVNKLGHATAESSSAINALKFVLSFWPCFSIWTDVRLF